MTEKWTRDFIIKRLLTILPSYFLVVILYPLFFENQYIMWLKLLPVDLLGIQTSYNSLFGILHNGGTWFVSCILFSYVLYPVIQPFVKSKNKYVTEIIFLVTDFILMYDVYIVKSLSPERLYDNPIHRAIEFTLGVTFAELVFYKKQKSAYNDFWKIQGIVVISALIAIIVAKIDHYYEWYRMMVDYLYLPAIIFLMYISSRVSCKFLEKNKVFLALSGMTYEFYLIQTFLWRISSRVIELLKLKGNNLEKIVVSFLLGLGCSFVVWKFYDMPIKKLLKKYALKIKK